MDLILTVLAAGFTFGLCYIVDKRFTHSFRSKAQHKSGLAVRVNKHYGGFGVGLSGGFGNVQNIVKIHFAAGGEFGVYSIVVGLCGNAQLQYGAFQPAASCHRYCLRKKDGIP